MTESLTATIVVKKEGTTKKGDPSVQLRFNEVDYPIWAFKWGVQKVENYDVGDEISLTYDDIGKEDKPWLVIKDVKGSKSSGSGGKKSGASSKSSAKSGADNSRDTMMAFSYLKDLHEQYLKGGAKDPVKDAIKAGAALYEGAKTIVNPPGNLPENVKKASSAQEGTIRGKADTLGIDTNDKGWKSFIKKRYGTLSHDDADHLIDMLQQVVDGKMGMEWTPDEEIMFFNPADRKELKEITS